MRSQLREKAKNRKPKGELKLNPPHLIADPYIRRQARFVIAAEKRLERLDRSHVEERNKTLKEFAKEREAQKTKPAKEFTNAWKEALQRTMRDENNRDDRRDLANDFDKTRD